MGEKIPSWQRRSQSALNQLFERKQFLYDLKLVKAEKMGIPDLFSKYAIPPYTVGYITHYVNTGKKDPSKIVPPFVMISEQTNEAAPSNMPKLEKVLLANDVISNKGLYLLFQSPPTKQELVDFIDTNWKSDIEPLI